MAGRGPGRLRLVAVLILVVTIGQLAVATFVPGLPQFEGKAFLGRLLAYPVMMLIAPGLWWLVARVRGRPSPIPWDAVTLIMTPFLIDVTGNTLDLYDRVWWWDDANHFVNWAFLCGGVGLMLARDERLYGPLMVLVVAGVGAIMAIGWEVGEYYAFIRNGTELDTAYTDTLGDEVLGTLGATLAGLILARVVRRRRRLTAPPAG